MAEQNFPDNTIYELDNLDVLRGMNSETVDLIATDPPFNTKRNRAGTAGFYVDNWRWGNTGKLPDQWAWNEVHPIWLDEIRDENRALFEVIEAAGHCHGPDIAAFLCFLSVRLLEMHRVLKPTGSLYLHCDHTANAYIRMALDAIFGAANLRDEITWKRTTSPKNQNQKSLSKDSDTIFRYSKGKEPAWNKESVIEPYNLQNPDEKTLRNYSNTESITGRRYATFPVYAPEPRTGESGKPITFRGKTIAPPPQSHWTVMGECLPGETIQQGFERLDREGKIHQSKPGGLPRFIRYLDEQKGRLMSNIWTDIQGATGNERTGSPDQKPLALYERIVLASSNPDDLVLDPFAGCATTLMAARKHGRRWVGIDRRPDARHHVVCRMLSIKANEAEKIRDNPMYGDWITARLAELETHYRTQPPVRTDEGAIAAPFLAPVHTLSDKPTLTHRQMKDFLVETFGLQCWACDFQAPDERYLQLDHVAPKTDGGSNHLDNRALLCQPCNMLKSNKMTMTALRQQNIKQGHLTKPPGTKRGQDGHPINLPQAMQVCSDALNRHKAGQPLQLGMM